MYESDAIVDYLVDAGIKRERLGAVGYGETKPIADNSTSQGKAANRRIEFTVTLPERWSSFDQLIAATAMRGYEEGLLPAPLRGDFPAFGKVYRHLDEEQRALAHSIAAERHYALNWLLDGADWDAVRTDT